jgi:hypothetical protein
MLNHRYGVGGTALAVCMLLATCTQGAIVADSTSEFSNVQGKNGWYYGYYLPKENCTVFHPLPQFVAGHWQSSQFQTDHWEVPVKGYYTMANSTMLHPTAAAKGLDEERADRHWISDVAGVYNIDGLLGMVYTTPANVPASRRGDGVIAMLYVDGIAQNIHWNGRTVKQVIMDDSSTTVRTYNATVSLHVGSVVDFLLVSRANCNYDTTTYTATISTASSVPEPASVGLLTAGALVLLRRRH